MWNKNVWLHVVITWMCVVLLASGVRLGAEGPTKG